MRITMKREKDGHRPMYYYLIKLNGKEVGIIQRRRSAEEWFWYTLVAHTAHHNTVSRNENRYFSTPNDALEDFKAWRRSL